MLKTPEKIFVFISNTNIICYYFKSMAQVQVPSGYTKYVTDYFYLHTFSFIVTANIISPLTNISFFLHKLTYLDGMIGFPIL